MTSTTLPTTSEAPAVEAASAAPAAPATPAECTNCGAMRTGEFCAACGQPAVRGRLTVRGVAQQVAHDVMNLDRGLVFTVLELTRRPGDAIRDYVDGRRVRYTGPVRYFVLAVALGTFASTQFGVTDDVARELVKGMGQAPPVTARQISQFMAQWMTLFMALSMPVWAAVTRGIFARARMTYAEHLALNLYAYAQQTLLLVVMLILAARFRAWDSYLVTAWMPVSAAYYGWTCTGFFRMRARWAVPLALIAMVVATVAYFVGASFVIGVGVGVARAAAEAG